MQDFNRALITKLSWNLLQNSKKKWVKTDPTLEEKASCKLPHRKLAIGCGKIFFSKEILKKGSCLLVGSNSSTCIWDDLWSWMTLLYGFIPKPRGDRPPKLNLVIDFNT